MNANKLSSRLQIAAIVCVAALAYPVWDSLQERVVNVGDNAPGFRIKTDDGKEISRSDFGGSLLVLNFWATWCPPCVEEMPSLDAMAQRLGPRGVVVLGVSVDTNEKLYAQFLKQARVGFLTARDPESGISAEYGTFKYPETYVIDRNGKVRRKHVGPRDWMDPQLLRDLESLL